MRELSQLPPNGADQPQPQHLAPDIKALDDGALMQVFRHLPFAAKKELQRVCKRWHRLLCSSAGAWGSLNLRLSNRWNGAGNSTSVAQISLEVLDNDCEPDVVSCRERLIAFLEKRAQGFHALNLVIDVDAPFENELAACRRALWFVMTNSVLPIIGLLSGSLKEVVVTVADTDDVPPSPALFCAASALRCLAHMLSALPRLEFVMLDCLSLREVASTFWAGCKCNSMLEVLIMRGCGLGQLPHASKLSSLQGLDLSCNALDCSWLDSALPHLTRLTSLILCNCGLAALPGCLPLLTRLEKLYLNHNALRGESWVPRGIGALGALHTLTLQCNGLQVLPRELAQLTSLTALELQSNKLTTLPSGLTALTNLQVLQLSTNMLLSIPPLLGCLRALRVLDLSRQATRYRTDEGVAFDINTTVRLQAPLDDLLALTQLQVLKLPVVELTDCERHAGGEDDEEAITRTVLFLNHFRARLVGDAMLSGRKPPRICTE